jgi:hypothetical protein
VQQGSLGQFDVLVDDAVVASRGGGFMTKVLGGGWPDPDKVVAAIRERQEQKA